VLVTVVISSYNRLSLLRRCLESVERQTHHEWECLVCDDGSTDGSREYTSELSSRDPRFRLLTGPRFGFPAGPRNRGIATARAEWVAFLDDDDLWHPAKLERQVALASDPNVDAVAAALAMFEESTPPDWVPHDPHAPVTQLALEGILLHRQPYPSTASVMVRRSRLRQVGGFAEHPAYRAVEDYDLWSRLGALPSFRWLWVPDQLAAYRVNGGDSISAWKRWFHPDTVRQRWAMLEILTRIVAAEWKQMEASRLALLQAITELAGDCAHRSAMLGWRSHSLFAYRTAAAFSQAMGDTMGALKRWVRAVRYGLVARPTAPAPLDPHIALLRDQITGAAKAILARETLEMDPLPLRAGERWSALITDTPDDGGALVTATA
jgi:glycosyltransferase involved in cell wall biosynthesis